MSQDYNEMITLLVEQVRPILANKPPAVVGAALADLTAIWIAGHVVPGDEKGTREYQDMLLAHQMSAIEALIPANAKAIGVVTVPDDDARRVVPAH